MVGFCIGLRVGGGVGLSAADLEFPPYTQPRCVRICGPCGKVGSLPLRLYSGFLQASGGDLVNNRPTGGRINYLQLFTCLRRVSPPTFKLTQNPAAL